MRILVCLACLLCLVGSRTAVSAERDHPDCTGQDRWPASSVGVHLRNLQLSEKAGGYDKVVVELLTSERLPPDARGRAIFRQVHKVTVHDGEKTFVAVTVNDASRQECSESGVEVFLVSVECSADGVCRRNSLPPHPATSALLPVDREDDLLHICPAPQD